MTSSSKYTQAQRDWAVQTYRETRNIYRSRLDCCIAIAAKLGAHENTVVRWVVAAEGRTRVLTPEEVPGRVRELEDAVERLLQLNRNLAEQVGVHNR